LLYGGLFLGSGAGLLAITYLLVNRAVGGVFVTSSSPIRSSTHPPAGIPGGPTRLRASQQLHPQTFLDLHGLLVQAGIALAIMAVISIVLGWVVAGRVLHPLRTMTTTTRQISEYNLHERLTLGGQHDELYDLGGTINGLLERMERAFDAQRRFVANASHELRTPLTVERTLLESILNYPDPAPESWRSACRRALAACEEQERLIEALLLLARSQRGLDQRSSIDLAVLAHHVLQACESDAAARGLTVDTTLDAATISGDAHLIERLVTNLLENALRHNMAEGRVEMVTRATNGHAVLSITNDGPVVPPTEVERLFLPFQRLSTDRTNHHAGLGVGLSIVQAIAEAHHATITSHARPQGGLDIEVDFPG
jgi:signal transduction histidine kinase